MAGRAGRHINVVLDRELEALLRAEVVRTRQPISAIVRDALRIYFHAGGSMTQRGWIEGYAAAYRAVQEKVKRAISEVVPFSDNLATPEDK